MKYFIGNWKMFGVSKSANIIKKIMDYVKPKEALKYYNVSENTLRSWSSQGKIKC